MCFIFRSRKIINAINFSSLTYLVSSIEFPLDIEDTLMSVAMATKYSALSDNCSTTRRGQPVLDQWKILSKVKASSEC